MASFFARLCEEDSTYLHLFLFDENLFPHIRLFLIEELIEKKFHIRISSMDNLEEFFRQIEVRTICKEIKRMILCFLDNITTTECKYHQ